MAEIQEVLKKVRLIQLHTRRAVNDVLAGEYSSVFKGRGMEFDEVREYVPGDDVRSIDWNVTARMGHPYVKRFVEERELTVLFLVDLSASGAFGSVHALKNEVAAEVCALLAFSAIKNHDKVGLVIFTDQVELYIPPKKGTRHVLRVIRELLYFRPRKAKTDIAGALDFAGKVRKKKGVLFLVSDFLGEGFQKPLRILGKRHDVIAVSVTDPREIVMPDVGLLELEDAETGEVVLMDTGSRKVRAQFERDGRARLTGLKAELASCGVDQVEVMTDRDYIKSLMRFFRTRERRARRG